jgi:hypothetical protein
MDYKITLRIVFTLTLAVLWCNITYSQQDTIFWFAAPDVDAAHGDSPIFIRVSTLDVPATINLSEPANHSFTNQVLNVPANSTGSINLTAMKAMVENQPPNKPNDFGLLLTSTTPVTAYYEVASSVNPDIWPMKGKNGLGFEFYIPSQNDYPNQVGFESFEIVATEDNTLVTITTTDDIVGHAAGATFQVTLNRGQTFSAVSVSQLANKTLAGSHITANKPIAITIKDDSIRPNPIGGYDVVGDQLQSMTILGMEYVVVKGFAYQGADNYERAYIMAVANTTQVFLDGSAFPITTLNAGQTYSMPLENNAYYVLADKPVYVYHISGHQTELGGAVLPHVTCTGSQQIGFNRTGNSSFALIVLTKDAHKGDFVVNGNSTIIQASDFSTVPGTVGQWVYSRKDLTSTALIPLGPNVITNNTGAFHLGILNMLGGSSVYGYFSDYSSLYLGPDIRFCENTTATLDAGAGKDTYLWNTGQTTQSIITADTGNFWVTVTQGLCTLSDTIHLGYYPINVVNLGEDVAVCQGEQATFSPGSGYKSYLWHDGSTSPTFTTTSPGQIWVEALDENNCPGSDTLQFSNYPLPTPILIKHF